MRVVDITLKGNEQISALVNITNRYPFTIQLRQGRYIVDGKSILGVCSLDRSKPITVEIYSDHCETLIEDLMQLSNRHDA